MKQNSFNKENLIYISISFIKTRYTLRVIQIFVVNFLVQALVVIYLVSIPKNGTLFIDRMNTSYTTTVSNLWLGVVSTILEIEAQALPTSSQKSS